MQVLFYVYLICFEHVGIDLIKNKARVVSYRRAVYEESDDTYAKAFGHDLDRPSPAKVNAYWKSFD